MALRGNKYRPQYAQGNRPLVMGIDPGFGGCISIIDSDSKELVDLIDMPLFQTESKARRSGEMNHVDAHTLAMLLDYYAKWVSIAVVEAPGAMPNQGLSSTFRFGYACGIITGVLAGLYLPAIPVPPGTWKVAMGLTSVKQASFQKIDEFYPQHKRLWQLRKHHDRAESVLIGLYAIRFMGQMIEANRK